MLAAPLLVFGTIAICHAQDASSGTSRSGVRPPNASSSASSSSESLDDLKAQKLFLEGRSLLNKGEPQAACDVLEQSKAITPALATLLNLGLCHQYSGRLATAHDYFRWAEVEATLTGDRERREVAHDDAAAIAARRATIVLRVPGGMGEALEVQIDEVPRTREVWEKPMYIDAGEHRISVQSSDGASWDAIVSVVDGGRHLVVIPDLRTMVTTHGPLTTAPELPASEADAVAPPVVSPDPISDITLEPVRPQSDGGLGTPRIVALTLAGGGLLALGASLIYTLDASSKFDESSPLCRSNNRCTPRGVQMREDAHASATRATVLCVSGGAALVGAVALWMLSAPASAPSDSLALDIGTRSIGAQWRGAL
jgi:hypothetical protein